VSFTREPGVGPRIGEMGRMRLAILSVAARQASNRSRGTAHFSAQPSSDPRCSVDGACGPVARRHGATGLSARAAAIGKSATAASRRAAAASLPGAVTAAPRGAASLSRGPLSLAVGTAPLAVERLSLGLGAGMLARSSLSSQLSGRKT
jgi:hypothetical protein